MSDYGKLMSRIWGDKDFTVLTAREQQVFMMLFSFPTRNLAGVVPLTLRRWASVTSDGTIENITAALEVLVHGRFVLIDWETEEVLIRTYIRNDEVWKQPNMMVRCLKFCGDVASDKLRSSIAEELERVAKELMPTEKPAQQKIREDTLQAAKALIKTFADGFQEPLWKPSEEPFENPLGKPSTETFGEPPGVSPTPAPAPTPAPGTDTKPPSGVSKGVESASKRGTRLPEDWKPPDDVVRSMHEQFPEVNLRLEHDQFSDYWHAKAGKDATKVDWVATWRRWIREAAQRRGTAGTVARPATSERRIAEIDAMRDNPRQPANRSNRLESLLSVSDRKEIPSGS